MTGESLYPVLEPLLAQIQKPIQYVGGELNSQVKPWEDAAVLAELKPGKEVPVTVERGGKQTDLKVTLGEL